MTNIYLYQNIDYGYANILDAKYHPIEKENKKCFHNISFSTCKFLIKIALTKSKKSNGKITIAL